MVICAGAQPVFCDVDKTSIIKAWLQYFSLPLLYYDVNLGLLMLSISVFLGFKFYIDLYRVL